ncbi:MAG: alpha/beta fold hydrolase [Acidobacteria bacterium]|nr:alpha/beta fold hydrolase [Acidobacteriota bacterium]
MTQHATTRFEISSDEGLPIRGVIEIPTNPLALVVTIHGFKGFKDWGFFPWTSESFAEAQIASCRFDMSRCGITEGSETFDRLDLFADDTYSVELADLERVIAHVRSVDDLSALPLFLFGHSRGGAIAILGARTIDRVDGVITWSSIATLRRWDDATIARWRRDGFLDVENLRTKQTMRMSTRLLDDLDANRERLDLEKALGGLALPMLVLHGASDESVPVEEATEIHDAADNASMVVIESATHTYGAIHPLVTVPRELRLAMAITRQFIQSWTPSRDEE